MRYTTPKIDERLYNKYGLYETLAIINKVGINHNHNQLFGELFQTKVYRESWMALWNPDPLWYKKFSNREEIQVMRGEIRVQMAAIEEEIKAKSPHPYETKKFPDNIDIDLLKKIVALSAKHLFFDIWATQKVTSFDEHLEQIAIQGHPVFRFGINRCNNKDFLPRLKNVFKKANRIKHYRRKKSSLEEQKAEWNDIRATGIYECLWGCVEAGLVSHGEFLAETLLKLLECPKISDNNQRRQLSTYLALGRLYLGAKDKKKAYAIFSKIPPLQQRIERDPQIGFLYGRVGQTRCVEGALEMYKLRHTKTNRSLCNELYLRSFLSYFQPGHQADVWEAVRERILITFMLIKYVYNEEI
jgi:hypothetical protein